MKNSVLAVILVIMLAMPRYAQGLEVPAKGQVTRGEAMAHFLQLNLTQEDLIQELSKAKQEEKINQIHFSDTREHPLGEYIALSRKYGLSKGFPDGSFQPDKPISRAEITALFFNAQQETMSYLAKKKPSPAPFNDVHEGQWFAPIVHQASSAGLVAGFPEGNFNPGDMITQVEMKALAGNYKQVLFDRYPGIQGVIHNNETICPEAPVMLYDTEGNLQNKTITNAMGQFHIPLTEGGTYELVVTLPEGKREYQLQFNEGESIQLQEAHLKQPADNNNMGEATRAEKKERKIKQTGSSTEKDKPTEENSSNSGGQGNESGEDGNGAGNGENTDEGDHEDGDNDNTQEPGEEDNEGSQNEPENRDYSFNKETGQITKYHGKDKVLIIPESIEGVTVTSIHGEAFVIEGSQAKQKFTRVVIPDTVTTMDPGTFARCSITNLTLSRNLTTIPSGAFANNSIISLAIPEGVEVIMGAQATYPGAFEGNQISNLDLGSTVTHIYSDAFKGNMLTRVNFPEGLIHLSGFNNNYLNNVSIPDSVKRIGLDAFYQNRIMEVQLREGLVTIGEGAFDNNQLQTVRFPQSLTMIDQRAFNFNRLRSIEFNEDSILKINQNAFTRNNLITVTLPKETTLQNYVFDNDVVVQKIE